MALGIPIKGDIVLVHNGDAGYHGMFIVTSYNLLTTTLQIVPESLDPRNSNDGWPASASIGDVIAILTPTSFTTGF